MSKIITYSDSIRKTPNKEIVTHAGVKLGLDPNLTEEMHSIIEADTTGIVQPLMDTPKQTTIEDTDYYCEFVTIIMKDSENHYRGFAERDYLGKTFRVETPIFDTKNECGKFLRDNILRTAKVLKHIS